MKATCAGQLATYFDRRSQQIQANACPLTSALDRPADYRSAPEAVFSEYARANGIGLVIHAISAIFHCIQQQNFTPYHGCLTL